MINMGHCRFENTYKALLECEDSIDSNDGEELSESEVQYRKKLFELMERMSFYTYLIEE